MALTGYGFVKEVISGDTLVIVGQPKGNSPPELKLNLASLQAPRLALKPATMSSTNISTKDQEPFAWQSREFLRSLCVGKKVYFKVEYTVEAIGRHFGSVYLLEKSESDLFVGPSSHRMSESICLTVAREGWCSVRASRDKGSDAEKSADIDELISLSQIAKEQGKGIFNKDKAADSIRTVKWDFESSKDTASESDVMALFNNVKDKPQKALIEYIRDGSSMKALLLDSMTLVTFSLAGVQCPRMNLGSKNTDDPQEYAQEAKFFTEVRLLNRVVTLKIGGVNEKFATFFGSVVHPSNNLNIAVELVKHGLAQPTDWSMSFTSPSAAASIHQAVHIAKKAKLRLWKNYSAPPIPGDQHYTGLVSEIISGDCFMVRVGSAEDMAMQPWLCENKKIHLSSIRAPRQSRSEEDEPLARESKEFLRSKLIGKTVTVNVEYTVGSGDQLRKFGTVTLLGKKSANIAVLLLEAGLASLIGHKQGAERSQFYHDLIEAEGKAQDEKKGLWASNLKTDADTKPLEINNAALAKANLQNFKSDSYQKKLTGIVDYVFNGARLKVYVPVHNMNIVLNLSGIQCARTGRTKTKGDEGLFGEEALAFTKSVVLQREIEFVVETADKGGNFIGTAYAKYSPSKMIPKPEKPATPANGSTEPTSDSYAARFASSSVPHIVSHGSSKSGTVKENLAVILLRYGLAKTSPIGIRFAKFAEELIKEETEAKESKAGLWMNYVEPVAEEAEKVENEETAVKSTKKELESLKVSVCHINNANSFFVHAEKEKPKVAEIESMLAELANKFGTKPSTPEAPLTIKKGSTVVALFNDGSAPKWYRASVQSIRKDEDNLFYGVRYMDFGNEEEIGADKIRTDVDDNLFKTPALAHETALAFVDSPPLNREYGRDAAMYLSQLTRGKPLQAFIHNQEKGKLVLTLLPAGKSLETEVKEEEAEAEEELITINGLLLREGLATMPRKSRPYVRGNAAEHEKKIMAHLSNEQEFAHDNHINMWAYGDPREDEDDRR